MRPAGAPARSLTRLDPASVVILVFAAGIAYLGPFDRVIAVVTGGSPLLRIALVAGLVLAGAACAVRARLSLRGRESRWPWIALAAAVTVAIMVCIVDGVLFRNFLPPGYVQAIQTESLSSRLPYYYLRAFQEEVIYRLFALSALFFLISRMRSGTTENISPLLLWTVIFAVQCLNVGINAVALEPISSTRLIYDSVRFVLPGVVWGWLYWRYGFAANATAHICCHAFLQPALGILV
jgi:hypothetical protein